MTKILIATGGTGGHIYPALAAAGELRASGCRVLLVGVFGASADKVRAHGFHIVEVGSRGFVSKGPIDRIRAIGAMMQALLRAWHIIRSFRPDAVAGFGGYGAFPTVMMAALLRVPTLIHDQNVIPGEANKILSRFSRLICVGFRQSLAAFPEGRAVWTGTPFRAIDVRRDRSGALKAFGLSPDRKTILVFGGSQGSRALNACVVEMLRTIPAEVMVQVILVTGRSELERYEAICRTLPMPVKVYGYLDNIDEAYAAADVAVTRAGAGTVTELALLGVPAVIVPYPGARNHQLANARVLEHRAGTVIIQEKDLSPQTLRDKIFLILDHSFPRAELKEQVRHDLQADPQVRLAHEIMRLADR